MSRMQSMEARGLGASDVQEVERFLTRLQAQKKARSSAPTSRSFGASSKVKTSSSSANHKTNRLLATYSPEPPDIHRLLQPTEMRLALGVEGNSSNPSGRPQTTPTVSALARNNSAGGNPKTTKRQMAIACGLKSVPVNDKKWVTSSSSSRSLPPSRLAIKDSTDRPFGGARLQSQVLLLATEEGANVRRGLSGSKIRSGARTPRRDSRGTPGFELLDSGIEHQEGSVLISASPRAQSIRYSSLSITGSGDNENWQPLNGNRKWNVSDQSLRLQKQLSNLNSIRAMKRASEMVQHRMDQTYLMSGNKLKLQHRYDIDDTDRLKLQEMAQTREDLISDLNKMKYPYIMKTTPSFPVNSFKPRPSHSMNGINHQPQPTFLTSPGTMNQPAIVHPSPASELESARDYLPKYHHTQDACKEEELEDGNVVDYDDEEINSWNGPL